MTEERIGNWIQVYSGKPFWPLDPRAEEISIIDVARSLSMKCRYGGHVMKFYSVAEHSVLVSQNVPAEHALWGLLHDASEAYSADIPRPLKRCLPDWPAMEDKITRAVIERFALAPIEPPEVKKVDFNICADEIAALLQPWHTAWDEMPVALGVEIKALEPWDAEELFLKRFCEITGQKMWELV